MKDLKVFVSYRIDKDAEKIGDESFLPVLCGSVFSDKKTGFYRDDNGENISEKRLSYCELTVQYWGWKNIKADYKGLMHFLTRFILNQRKKEITVVFRRNFTQKKYKKNMG